MLQKHGVASINGRSSCKICSCHKTLLHFSNWLLSYISVNLNNPTGSPDGPKEYNATSELHFGKSHSTKHVLRNVRATKTSKANKASANIFVDAFFHNYKVSHLLWKQKKDMMLSGCFPRFFPDRPRHLGSIPIMPHIRQKMTIFVEDLWVVLHVIFLQQS